MLLQLEVIFLSNLIVRIIIAVAALGSVSIVVDRLNQNRFRLNLLPVIKVFTILFVPVIKLG